MQKLILIFKQVRLSSRFYFIAAGFIALFILAFVFDWLYDAGLIVFYAFLLATAADVTLLFRNLQPVTASRISKYARLSNGDVNELSISVENSYAFKIYLTIIDELPPQFQLRDFLIRAKLLPGQQKKFAYEVRPVERGEYHFGILNLFVKSPIGLVERHIKSGEPFMLASYPSFIRLKHFELLAISNRLTDSGAKKIRRIGHSTEFEQIKDYVGGDDIRTINWKATARSARLMVNHFRDERAQNVFNIIDMGRVMKMPFDGMTLLDYAVNASLVIGHVAWIKQDKPGLIGFSEKVSLRVPADRKGNQMLRLQEALYNAKTGFAESNYENLLSTVRTTINQRSLIILYTNFETLSSLRRQLRYLKRIAAQHLLVTVFFENTGLRDLLNSTPTDTFKIYEQTIARKFDYEKRQIALELKRHGIIPVYTPPDLLTVNTLNKYLEIKTRGLI